MDGLLEEIDPDDDSHDSGSDTESNDEDGFQTLRTYYIDERTPVPLPHGLLVMS